MKLSKNAQILIQLATALIGMIVLIPVIEYDMQYAMMTLKLYWLNILVGVVVIVAGQLSILLVKEDDECDE